MPMWALGFEAIGVILGSNFKLLWFDRCMKNMLFLANKHFLLRMEFTEKFAVIQFCLKLHDL